MIIKSGGIKSGDGPRICSYATQQGENERVDVLKDQNDQLLVTDQFAELKGRKNGLLHIVIAPSQELTAEELKATVEAIRQEFGFNENDPETLTMHESRRADGSLQKHWHLIRPAADNETGKTYRLFRSKAKDEAISRLLELQFGHQLTSGANNKFAAMRLREQGYYELADQLAEALGDERPRAAYSSDEHQQSKRRDFDLPALRQSLKELIELPRDQQPQALAELIDREGLELTEAITEGRGRSRINLNLGEGIRGHNANRTLKIKASEVARFIHETKEFLNDRRPNTTEFRPCHASGSAIADHQRAGEYLRVEPRNVETAECPSENIASDCQKLTDEANELAAAAAQLKPEIDRFKAASSAEMDSAAIEPIPDIRDPNLMKKLAAMLKRQMDKAAALARKLQAGGPASFTSKMSRG